MSISWKYKATDDVNIKYEENTNDFIFLFLHILNN